MSGKSKIFCKSKTSLPASVIGPFQVRFRSVSSPFRVMGEKWDLQGICMGITTDLLGRKKEVMLNEISEFRKFLYQEGNLV